MPAAGTTGGNSHMGMGMRTTALTVALAAAPSVAAACGGLFCNTAQPVNQAAERILFARDGQSVEMHVRLSYAGPPAEFGWILPVPPDVETALSSEALFAQLDQNYAPIFQLQTDFGDNCAVALAGRGAPAAEFDDADGAPQAPGVQVLSREAVGPFDQVTLQADNVQVLRDWLDANGYQIPAETDEKLAPYIELGAVFVALRLLPGADAGDVQPLRLRFTSQLPAIPIVPTSVAAQPDMGVIVHLLGDARAIPKNYAHVQINEAAIDWVNGGANYADVVSAAADEAEGKAFATDFAGPHNGFALNVLDQASLDALRGAETLEHVIGRLDLSDADYQRILADYFEVPEGVPPQQYFQCPDCFGPVDWQQAVDGAALAARIEQEVNPAREALNALFGARPYLTRLYSTLSAAEMDLDPVFSFNRDLGDVDRTRVATQVIVCDANGDVLPALSYVETPSGLRFRLADGQVPDAIVRQDGATVRGNDAPAAQVIERMEEQGQPRVIADRTQALRQRYGSDAISAGGGDDGCGCSATGRGAGAALWLLPLALFGVRRRRR